MQLFSSRMAIQLCTILQSIIVARLLGPEGKGLFTEITIYPSLIGSVAMLGLYTGIVRLSAKPNIRLSKNITKAILGCCTICGVVGSIICYFVNYEVFHNTDSIALAAQIYAIYVLIYTLNRGLSAFNNGTQNLKLFSISSVILYPTYFFPIILLWICGLVTVSTCIYALLLANIISCAYLFIKNEEKLDGRKSFPIKWLFKYSIKFSIADFAEPIYLYFDKALLAIFLGAYDLGLYTIAISSGGLINLFSNTFSIKLFSDIANNQTSNVAQYIRYNLILMGISAIVLSILFPIIIPLIYGKAYSPSVIPAIIALLICIVQGQTYILERSILATGRPFVGVIAKAISMGALAAVLLILYFFGQASVLTACIAYLFTSLIYYTYIRLKATKILKLSGSLIPQKRDIQLLVSLIKQII